MREEFKIIDSLQNDLTRTASLNLRSLVPGSYNLLILSENDKVLESHKVQIAK